MIPRDRLTPCLLFLHSPLSRTLKKNKTKQNKTKNVPCTSVYNHKIPFQCFISINSHTDPNFTTTFVKGCFKCQKQFFFQILTNGKFSFYFFADRFEVKKPDLLGQCPNFFYNVLQNNCLWIGFCKVKTQNCCLENPGIDPGTSRMLSGRSTI